MCYLCLQDWLFELPVKPELKHKKKRLVDLKSLLNLASQMAMVESNMEESKRTLCEDKVEELKAEQYKLSREF